MPYTCPSWGPLEASLGIRAEGNGAQEAPDVSGLRHLVGGTQV